MYLFSLGHFSLFLYITTVWFEDLRAVRNCSKNFLHSSSPFPLWRFLQWMGLKNVCLVVCLMQTVPLFILWWPNSSSSTCPFDGEDYCNSLLERLPSAQLCHLQPVQNAVTHSHPVLSKYNPLPCTFSHLFYLLWSSCLILKFAALVLKSLMVQIMAIFKKCSTNIILIDVTTSTAQESQHHILGWQIMSFAKIGLQVRNFPRKSVLNHIYLSENIKIKYTFLATFKNLFLIVQCNFY